MFGLKFKGKVRDLQSFYSDTVYRIPDFQGSRDELAEGKVPLCSDGSSNDTWQDVVRLVHQVDFWSWTLVASVSLCSTPKFMKFSFARSTLTHVHFKYDGRNRGCMPRRTTTLNVPHCSADQIWRLQRWSSLKFARSSCPRRNFEVQELQPEQPLKMHIVLEKVKAICLFKLDDECECVWKTYWCRTSNWQDVFRDALR